MTIAQSESSSTQLSAADHINLLNQGVLLVRLPTKQNTIDALIASDRISQAEQIKRKVERDNLELIAAIDSAFDFCPVYFFYSHDSKYVSSGELEKVGFVNSDLELDSTIQVESEYYYTAELGLIGQNTGAPIENIPKGQEDNPNYRNEAKYYGGTNMRFHAFIIKDSQFNQLERPFPYYSRTLNSFFIKKTTYEVIRRMNLKLMKFFAG